MRSDTFGLGTPGTTRRTFLRAAVATPLAAAAVTSTELATAGAAEAAPGDSVWTAGLNADGQLGDGTLTTRPSFQPIAPATGTTTPLLDVKDVAGGRQHAMALRQGLVYAWGDG